MHLLERPYYGFSKLKFRRVGKERKRKNISLAPGGIRTLISRLECTLSAVLLCTVKECTLNISKGVKGALVFCLGILPFRLSLVVPSSNDEDK